MTTKLKSLFILLIIALGLNLTGCSTQDLDTHNEQNNNANVEITNNENSLDNKELEHTSKISKEDEGNTTYNIPENARKGIVIDAIDGDTVKVEFENGDIESVRILLINTPEKNEKFGSEASNFAYQELNNKTVYIEPDVENRDKYDRLLGYVWYEKDNQLKLYNKEIILESLAKVAYVYDSKKYLDTLNEAQESVEYNKLNIWERKGYATNKGYKYDMSVYEDRSSSSSSSNSKDVVYTTKSGKRYHLDRNCKGLAKASNIFEKNKEEAIKSGLSLCGYED
ncbi:thermonuclease family protein [Romboutsia sp.]|uniref:thermonuclease family protein n=1 Tax=Romboutsia sp. TaxID=1965302 RepID=UPI002CF217C0|nr:thermonuclease family protein [Romboutsia sp.]HSQ88307.1 thermonuclease family protein [Romboutsia sp.]